MVRSISVSTQVFAAIWSKRRDSEDSEDAILTRVLGCKAEKRGAAVERLQVPASGGVIDSRNDVHFPEGFQIFRYYKRKEYLAEASSGLWVRKDTGDAFPTLNQLNASIAAGSENVWNGNWKFRDTNGQVRSINILRKSSN